MGIADAINHLIQSVLNILTAFVHAIWGVISGIFDVAWGLVEQVAGFVGASAHFVASNIIILGLLLVAFVIYRDRNTRGTVGNNLKKKAQ